MLRLGIAIFVSTCWMACAKIDTQKTCQGEWSYIVGDTAYCELLIEGGRVFPYHNDELNSYSYPYKIQMDTFYIYGNEGTIVEQSPIKYIDANTFQILGITPSKLRRISYPEAAFNSLSKYKYRAYKLSLGKSMVELYEENVFEEIEEAKRNFESTFQERRSIALYKWGKKTASKNLK
ncbi:MAG: Unknown protein [uncultured Aureispira sp.]|uniref:Uncharacterized protein n=1 Tax=uncultured Aureispira sp. TaxID=1331704 RepID=A0A6S6THD5_9BACT|nr:MAG: Unknown protein [uncultured Aureispira sp.]